METLESRKGATKRESDNEMISQTRHFTPASDIFETERDIYVVMDMPGVDKDQVLINLDRDLLEIRGEINAADLSNLQPLYAEYNVGNYYRKFTLSDKIAKNDIDAKLEDGVLTVKLPKVPEAMPRSIKIN